MWWIFENVGSEAAGLNLAMLARSHPRFGLLQSRPPASFILSVSSVTSVVKFRGVTRAGSGGGSRRQFLTTDFTDFTDTD